MTKNLSPQKNIFGNFPHFWAGHNSNAVFIFQKNCQTFIFLTIEIFLQLSLFLSIPKLHKQFRIKCGKIP
jgi:hypothetical protein